MFSVNQKTNRQACQHDTQPRGMWQGRFDSTRDYLFVEILGTSWKIDHRVPKSKHAEVIAGMVAEFASAHGRTASNPEPRFNGTRPVPDWRHTEFRVSIVEDHGKPWRGAYRFFVSAVDHDESCYL